MQKNDTKKTMVNQKLKLLFTIINRNKAEYYMDLIQSFESNLQVISMATGTATQDIKDLLGIKSDEKAVIISVVKEEKIQEVMYTLENKFETIKGGKGIAYTIPLTSVIGVTLFRFLSNSR